MIMRMFPHVATPMEILRTAVSSMGHWNPDSGVARPREVVQAEAEQADGDRRTAASKPFRT